MLRVFRRALRKYDGIGLSRRLSGIDFVLNSDELPEYEELLHRHRKVMKRVVKVINFPEEITPYDVIQRVQKYVGVAEAFSGTNFLVENPHERFLAVEYATQDAASQALREGLVYKDPKTLTEYRLETCSAITNDLCFPENYTGEIPDVELTRRSLLVHGVPNPFQHDKMRDFLASVGRPKFIMKPVYTERVSRIQRAIFIMKDVKSRDRLRDWLRDGYRIGLWKLAARDYETAFENLMVSGERARKMIMHEKMSTRAVKRSVAREQLVELTNSTAGRAAPHKEVGNDNSSAVERKPVSKANVPDLDRPRNFKTRTGERRTFGNIDVEFSTAEYPPRGNPDQTRLYSQPAPATGSTVATNPTKIGSSRDEDTIDQAEFWVPGDRSEEEEEEKRRSASR
ncbi:hypothetical protein NDN08_005712 [Rhodosorus marinus]|uniref:RRM domain-containing protein n=1 Tax=Rhodosorus marinus TaxID=101924 RepID=A0AAV8V481_9RHOD|nr:hypothetical protein NDN08_005712 [Rhodosorus marinus]